MDVSGALKIIKNILELRKLQPPKVERAKNSQKKKKTNKPPNTTKPKPDHPKKFQDELQN